LLAHLSRARLFKGVLVYDGMKMELHCLLCACGHAHMKTVRVKMVRQAIEDVVVFLASGETTHVNFCRCSLSIVSQFLRVKTIGLTSVGCTR
jgi:hypothetical protein